MTHSGIPTFSVLTLAIFLGAGCSGDPTCDAIEGKLYRSTTSGDGGLGSDGEPTSRTWTLSFQRETVSPLSGNDYERYAYGWSYSDSGQAGLYECDGAAIRLGGGYGEDAFDEGNPISADYNLEADSIDLEGKTYVFDRDLDE